jgi:hypothetical protein
MEYWHEFGPIVTGLASAGSLGVAAAVATIIRSQWKVNREKLRLDLFERRFEVYYRSVEMCRVLTIWEGEPSQKATVNDFYRAFHESKFLFPPESEVLLYMEEIRERGAYISNFDDILKAARESGDGGAVSLKKLDHVK